MFCGIFQSNWRFLSSHLLAIDARLVQVQNSHFTFTSRRLFGGGNREKRLSKMDSG
jgi:hypothetical protein